MAVINGDGGPNTLNDTPDDDIINGLGGDDRIIISQGGDDEANGGDGSDTLEIDYSTSFTAVTNTTGPTPDGGGGFSGGYTNNFDRSVTYTGIERFVISTGSGNDNITTADGDDVMRLGNGDDVANGGAGRDNIRGGDGNDTLDGGAGADKLIGGGGNDTYIVDAGGDVVEETSAANGIDTVRSSISYTLGQHLENLVLTGAAAINGTGNELDNTITGNGAANILDGGLGADTLQGGGGDDFYIVDTADTVIEGVGEGTDTVRANFSYTLGANVERLILAGNDPINGTGNELDNVITGNDAANVIDGRAGADTMRGNGGNDTYFVDNAGDVIDENPGGGTDTVRSSVSYNLGIEVERLVLTGGAIEGGGNALDNVIVGNTQNNTLRGFSGNDRLEGRTGDDQLFGGLGNDILYGQEGADGFRFESALDANTNVDTLADFVSADDTIFLKNSIFTEAGPNGTLSEDAFVEGTAAADAEDRIIYDSASGFIYYDADGAGGAEQILFARVSPGTDLSNTDFVIYG